MWAVPTLLEAGRQTAKGEHIHRQARQHFQFKPDSANVQRPIAWFAAADHKTGLRTRELAQLWVGSFRPCSVNCFFASLDACFSADAIFSAGVRWAAAGVLAG